MKIVSVAASFGPQNLATALKSLQDLKILARQMAGCSIYEVYVAADDPNSVLIYQIWDSETAFETYRNGKAFTQMGKEIGPMMTKPPLTDIFEVSQSS